MVNVHVEDSQPSVSEADLYAFEQRFGVVLPDDYKEFLLKHNGGKPTPRRYKTLDGVVESSFIRMLPLADLDAPNLVLNYTTYNQGYCIPNNLIPIGEDPIGNQICMSLSGEDTGTVYHWSYDWEDEVFRASYKYMRKIAGSFSEFLECLFMPS